LLLSIHLGLEHVCPIMACPSTKRDAFTKEQSSP
jgi:hypothetical protein